MQKITFLILSTMFLSGCAAFVYQYDYERENGIQYPQSVVVGYYPSFSLMSLSNNLSLSAGLDMAYLGIPMGSNIMIYNKNFFAGIRIGDQWSTSSNEVLGAEVYGGINYFLNKTSLLSLGSSYTTLNLTPHDIVKGNLKGLKLTFLKTFNEEDKTAFLFPELSTIYLSNNLYLYDFTGTVQRISDTTNDYKISKLHYKNYLWSSGFGINMKFTALSCNIEIGKIFPRYIYDENDKNPIRYEVYLNTGVYLDF